MLWNGVSSTPRLSAHRCRKPSRSSSTAAAASAPLRGGGQNQYSARQPSRCTFHGRPCSLDHPGDAVGEPLRQRDRHREVLLAQRRGQRGAGRGEGEAVRGERAAHPGDVDPVAEHRPAQPVGDLRRHAVRRQRHAARDRLADDEQVGVQAPRGRGAARARRTACGSRR